MPTIPQYLIESSLCLLVFYEYYRLVLRGRGGFMWNRMYLLLTPVLSLIIPGLSLDFLLDNFSTLHSQVVNLDLAATEIPIEKNWEYRLEMVDILMVFYLLGVGFWGFRFLDRFWELMQSFKTKKRLVRFADWKINQEFPKTSFFSYAFWNDLQLIENKEFKSDSNVLKIEEKHGSDVLFIELLTVLYWFNPLFLLYRNELKELHENNYLFHKAQVSGIFKDAIENQPKQSRSSISKNNWSQVFLFGASMSIVVTLISLFSFDLIRDTPFQKPLDTTYVKLQKIGSYALYKKEKLPPVEHKIIWGKQEIKLEKIAAPNGYSGEIEVELEDFKKLYGEPIRVYEGTQERAFKTMDIHLQVLEEKGRLWFPNVENGAIELEHPRLGNVKDRIMEGDILSFTGMAEEVYLTGISVKIKNPLAIYRPEINVAPITKSAPAFGFQIVNLPNKRALLKIDTSNIATRHIVDLYVANPQYQIVHIADFKTNQRFVDATARLFSEEKIEENYLSVARFDIHVLPEYQAFQNQLVELDWGQMIANPSSENYIVKDFLRSCRKELKLKIGTESFDIQSFRMISKQMETAATAFHSEKIKESSLQAFLRKIVPETSIYFDDLIIQKNGQYYYLPINFVFNIGKDTDKFTLTVKASDENTIKSINKREGYIEYLHYPMSELIAILTGNERMEFENRANEPVIDAAFESEYLSLRQGEELLLKRLYQQYYYSSQIRFETRPVWIIDPVENTESIDTLEYFYHIKPDLKEVTAANKEQGLETLSPGFIDDLANLMEREFDLIVFNESGLTKAYGLGLDLSSFSALRKQLEEDYGIKMREEERVIKFVKVVYPE